MVDLQKLFAQRAGEAYPLAELLVLSVGKSVNFCVHRLCLLRDLWHDVSSNPWCILSPGSGQIEYVIIDIGKHSFARYFQRRFEKLFALLLTF